MRKYGLLFLVIIISGCVPPKQGYFSSLRRPHTIKERAAEGIRYISTSDEAERLEALTNDQDVRAFLDSFWVRRDPSPGTQENEAREEHLRRLEFANDHLGGSHLDIGRVYILYGPPDERHSNGIAELDLFPYHARTIETWVYYRKATGRSFPTVFDDLYPGLVKFIFADLYGYGFLEQIYSTEEKEKVDARVYTMTGRE